MLLPAYVWCVNVIIHRGLASDAAVSAHAFACDVEIFAYIPCLYRLNQPIALKVST